MDNVFKKNFHIVSIVIFANLILPSKVFCAELLLKQFNSACLHNNEETALKYSGEYFTFYAKAKLIEESGGTYGYDVDFFSDRRQDHPGRRIYYYTFISRSMYSFRS